MSLHPAEEATIRAFIIPERRPRYLEQMAIPKKRSRFLDRLNHCRDLDPRFSIPFSNVSTDDLMSRGAPQRCRLISASAKLDGQELALQEALDALASDGWGTIACCVPGRLAYYRDEEGEREFLLVRQSHPMETPDPRP